MHNKLTVGVGLVAVLLFVTALLIWRRSSTEPRLRVGMEIAEVDQAMAMEEIGSSLIIPEDGIRH